MRPFRQLALFALLAACLAAPWFFGAVELRAQVGIWGLLTLGAVACLIDEWTSADRPAPVPGLLIVMGLAMVLGLVQLIPLPIGWLEWLSPATAHIWTAAGASTGAVATLSLYPFETRYTLSLLLAAVCAFWIASRCIEDDRSRLIFVTAVVTNGCLLTALGIAHYLTAREDNVIYWTRTLAQGGRPFASFVNRNHAGGYLNLTLAMAFGGSLWAYLNGQSTTTGIARTAHRRVLGLAVTAACLILVGVVFSLSRSAVLGTLLGVAGLLGILSLQPRWRRFAIIPLVLACVVVGITFWSQRGAILIDRFQRVADGEQGGAASRLDHWKDSLQAVPDFPVLGSGLGTYRYIYRRYQQTFQAGWFYHAENQYLEALVEGGIVGLGLLLVALGWGWIGLYRGMTRADRPSGTALGCAGLFALLTQAGQSFFDFGLYLPSNALLLAAICGAGWPRTAERHGGARAWRHLPVAISLVLTVAMGFASWGMYRRAAGLEQIQSARAIEVEPGLSRTMLDRQITRIRGTTRDLPGDAEAQRQLARLLIAGYRLAALEQLQSVPGVSDAWSLTSPLMLYARLQESGDDPGPVERLRSNELVRGYLLPAVEALRRSLAACPLIPEAHLSLAQLIALDPSSDAEQAAELVAAAARLKPADPDILFSAGLMQLQSGQVESGLAFWRQSLEHSPRYVAEIVPLALQLTSIDTFMEHGLPQSAASLVAVAGAMDPRLQVTGRRQIAERAERQLGDRSDPQAEALRGEIAALRGDRQGQIEHLRRAITAAPRELEWRYQLAQLLVEQGQLDEAREHLVVCVRLAPHRDKYHRLLTSITQTIHTSPAK